MPSPIPDPTLSDLAALRAPDLTEAIAMTLSHVRAMDHVSDEVLAIVGRALRHYNESALPACGFEIVKEVGND